jgi:hypothetical protein
VNLPEPAASRFATLQRQNPYSPPEDHSDEFIIYSGGVRDADWGEGVNPAAVQEFRQMTASERVEQWKPNQSGLMQELASRDPGAALETLEEGLAKNLDDVSFWSEGISGLASALERAGTNANEAAVNG